MKIDFQKIKHNYIKRVVIYAILLYRSQSRTDIYKTIVIDFVKKRTGLGEIEIEVGPNMAKKDHRKSILQSIFVSDDTEIKHMSMVIVKFRTGYKFEEMQIDLNNSEKYEIFLDQ